MSTSPTTRVSLLLGIRDPRDHLAWGQFVHLYAPLIHGYAQRPGLQDADAADVAQEALRAVVPAIRKLQYDPQAGSFRGWLFTVVRRKLRDYLAKERRPDRAKGGSHVINLLHRQTGAEESEAWDREFQQRLLVWASGQVRQSVQESTWEAFRQTAIEGKPAKGAFMQKVRWELAN